MAPKYHPTPPSGGDRKALKKELGKARAMTGCSATYVERPCQASAFVKHFIQQERCGHMSGLSARS
jgi:hypothetical protein